MILRNHTGHRCGASHQRAKASNAVVRRARELRERKGMSYARIAAELGQTWGAVRDWCEYRTRADA